MPNWEKFEIESVEYLKNEFKNSEVDFKNVGGKDANNPDILVFKNSINLFSIESKLSPAQAGQFVVDINDSGFSLSTKSRSKLNSNTQMIIDYLNENGIRNSKKQAINLNDNILFDWVKEHYVNKGSKFIITSTVLNSYKVILPIEEIDKYFKISACLRVKNSGSSYLKKDKISEVLPDIDTHFIKINLKVHFTIEHDSKKKVDFINFEGKITLAKTIRYFGNNLYLSPHANGSGFYIKNLSNTKNSNVIFSLKYEGVRKNLGKMELETTINNM